MSQNDILLDPAVTCGGTGQCEDCEDDCQLYPETYAYGNKLFNIKDDPREEHDLYDQHPEVRRFRAVVYPSNVLADEGSIEECDIRFILL